MSERKISLPTVTLCSASSVAIPETMRALTESAKDIDFSAVKIFTHLPIDNAPKFIEQIMVENMRSRQDYSNFMLKELVKYIDTDHVLVVQWDGYILNYLAWREKFLEFDYIGAVWPQFDDGFDVGNGGFSLRSKKLLEACALDQFEADDAEDILICRRYRPLLERDYSIRFADSALASSFSYERAPASGFELGFHGVFNMIDVLGGRRFCAFYSGLDKQVIGNAEHNDILRRAWQLKNFKLVARVLAYHLSTLRKIPQGLKMLWKLINT